MYKHIYTVLALLLALVGCSKEPFEGFELEGQLRIGVEMLDRYYAETIDTRSGTFDANDREKKLFDGKGFVFVFKASDGSFQQYAPLQKDTEGYYAILEASTVGVTAKGVANVDIPTAIQTKIDNKTLVIGDLANIYTAYTTANNILKNTDTGLLPKSSATLPLTKIDKTELAGKSLTFDFDYVRVDVDISAEGGEFPKLSKVSALNAPALPLSSDKIAETHTVEPTAADAKTVQGLYLYPNAIDILWSKDDAVSLMLEVETSEGVDRYYKILMQHPSGTGFVYDLRRDYRYLVKITSLTSDGYATEPEAIAAPHSNIDYNITYDSNSTHIVDNGQYYIGVSKGDYYVNVESYRSNMLYAIQNDFTMVANNDPTWEHNSDGTYSVDIAFTLGDGDSGNILSVLSGDVILPAGASFATPLADNWKTTRTEQKYTINLSADFIEGDVIIELGELTQTIKLIVDREVVTDYTDKAIVEQLTGLPDGYGGVSGLRVANSYITPPMSNMITIFYIPVKDRIKEFWEEYASTSTSQYNIPDEDWTFNEDFTVELSWYDGEEIDGLKVEKSVSPETNTTTPQNAIKVIIPKDFEPQNVVVNVRKSGTIIWSWHLWVTDYNPYKTASFNNPQRTRVNEVVATIGGDIHSYDGEIWSSGIYANKLIMDRNLGGRDTTYEGQNGEDSTAGGALFYQFGRKDPFPGAAGKYVVGINDKWSEQISYATSVNNPTIFIALGSNWSNETSAQRTDILWNDENMESSSYITGKSIFDPSPLGFRIPTAGVFENFDFAKFPASSSTTKPGHIYNNFAYFPVPGTLNATSKVLTNSRKRGYLWYASGANQNDAFYLGMYLTSVSIKISYYRTSGLTIRPIQE